MSFVALVASPLLIEHVRNPGGRGGRRICAGTQDGAWALQVATGRVRASVTSYATPLALVHAYDDVLRAARRAALTSAPEPAPLTLDALRAAGADV